MAVLVVAEHDGKHLKPGTANAVTAAVKMGSDVTVLVAGHQCAAAAQVAARLSGVKKVLLCDAAQSFPATSIVTSPPILPAAVTVFATPGFSCFPS